MNSSVERQSDGRDEDLARVEVTVLAIIFAITLVGNLLVLVALLVLRRKKLSRMYFFIVHLSIADLITAFFNVLPQLGWDVTYRFIGGPILCKIIKFCQTLGPYLSSYVLLATAVDRYRAICSPLVYHSWSFRRAKIMVSIAWIISLLFCVPQTLVFSYQEINPGVWDCWATFIKPWGEKTYVTWYSVFAFIIPLSVLTYTYSCICRKIWRNTGAGFHIIQTSPVISRAKVNTIKQMIIVISFYIICSTPFTFSLLWATWDEAAVELSFFRGPVFTILTLLSSLNSCVNPWIYLTFNKELIALLVSCGASDLHYRGSSSSKERSRLSKLVSWRST